MSGKLNSINRQAFDNFNMSFGQFVADKRMDDNTVVKADRWSLTGIKSLKADSGDYRWNLFRNAGQVTDNNAIRKAFLASVSDIYGGENHIPESVKKAMKAGDFDGKGRPLTARRIRATLAAIRTDIDHKKIADVVESQEWLFGGQHVINIKRDRPDLVNVLDQYTDKLALDILDVMKTTILPDIEKGKAPSVAKMRRFLEAMVEGEKPETRNMLSGHDLDIDTPEIISSCWNAAFNRNLVRNEALVKFFFNDSKQAAEATRNMKQAFNDILETLPIDDPVLSEKRFATSEKIGGFDDQLFFFRHFVVVDLSPKEIGSLLAKMADEQGSDATERKKKTMTLQMTFDVVSLLPNAEQKAEAYKFLRQVGQSILDRTIRPRKHHTEDALYGVAIKILLSNEIQQCAKNRMKNAKTGNHDLPESIMGTPELDAQLKQRVDELRVEGEALQEAANNAKD